MRTSPAVPAAGSGGWKWPKSLPTSFLRPAWRGAVLDSGDKGSAECRRIWEAATLLALHDRLRAGDIWVEGSRQWRAIEGQLISPALFAAMREAGPLPVAVPATAEEYLAGRRTLLERRLREVNAKAVADTLEDVRINGGEIKITPLKAVTPEAAEDAAERLYAMMPNARITAVLGDVHRWTGFADAFTHLHTVLDPLSVAVPCIEFLCCRCSAAHRLPKPVDPFRRNSSLDRLQPAHNLAMILNSAVNRKAYFVRRSNAATSTDVDSVGRMPAFTISDLESNT